MSRKKMTIAILCLFLLATRSILAGPNSANFELRDYNFGAGGTEDSSSSNFSLFGIVGEVAQGDLSSTNFGLGGGLPNTIMAALPPAPSFSNPGSTYDRLLIVIDNIGNPSDSTFAVAITESSDTLWADIRYVQSDDTLGTVLGLEDFQTYASFGGATGQYITGLQPDTTYKVKVKARQGIFTESGWSAESTATTSVPSLSFGVDADTVVFDELNFTNSYTDSTKSTVLTTSTNAYNGYIVYGHATQELTSIPSTIPHYASTNSSPTTWSGTGFGYTTSDSNLIGGTPSRFTSGGPKFAGFTSTSPGDPVADTAGPVLTPITNENYTVSYRLTTSDTQPAGVYKTTLVYIIVPTF